MTEHKTGKEAEPPAPATTPLVDRPIGNPNAALVDRRGDPEPPVTRTRPAPVARTANPHASPVAPPVEGDEALDDPTPMVTQGAEVIAPPKPIEPPEQALIDSIPDETPAAKTKAGKKADDDDDEENVSGGEKARRVARQRS